MLKIKKALLSLSGVVVVAAPLVVASCKAGENARNKYNYIKDKFKKDKDKQQTSEQPKQDQGAK